MEIRPGPPLFFVKLTVTKKKKKKKKKKNGHFLFIFSSFFSFSLPFFSSFLT